MIENSLVFWKTHISCKHIVFEKNKRKIVCLTSYTPSITKAVEKYVDILLIGDSLGSVIYNMDNTRSVTLNMMKN